MTIRFRTPKQISTIESKASLLEANLLQPGRLDRITTTDQLNRLQDIESRIRKTSDKLSAIATKLREHRANIKVVEPKKKVTPAKPKEADLLDFSAKLRELEKKLEAIAHGKTPPERVQMIG